MVSKVEMRMFMDKVLKSLEMIEAKVSALPVVRINFDKLYSPTLVAMASLNRPAHADDLARMTGISRAYQSKILCELVDRGAVARLPHYEHGVMYVLVAKKLEDSPHP